MRRNIFYSIVILITVVIGTAVLLSSGKNNASTKVDFSELDNFDEFASYSKSELKANKVIADESPNNINSKAVSKQEIKYLGDFSPKTVNVKQNGTVTFTNLSDENIKIVPDNPALDSFIELGNKDIYTFVATQLGNWAYWIEGRPTITGSIQVE